MFYLICYFNLPLYFRLFVCFVIQGFKVQSSYYIMWGPANLHSF